MRRRSRVWLLALVVLFSGVVTQSEARKRPGEPKQVKVQHILIGFKKSIRGKKLARTKREAQALAMKLLERAQAGEDFDAMVKEYTNDSYPGIFVLANDDAPVPSGAYRRREMATYFGDVSFRIDVGEVGLAKYHGGNSPYGWHIIKRLE